MLTYVNVLNLFVKYNFLNTLHTIIQLVQEVSKWSTISRNAHLFKKFENKHVFHYF